MTFVHSLPHARVSSTAYGVDVQEERMPASRLEGMELQLNKMPLDASHNAKLCKELYRVNPAATFGFMSSASACCMTCLCSLGWEAQAACACRGTKAYYVT